MANTLPDLEAIPDDPKELYFVKQCFRALQDRLVRLEVAGEAASEEEEEVEDLATRLGTLERKVTALENAPAGAVQTLSAVRYGAWRQTSSAAGVGSFVWDTEDLNVGGFTRASSNTRIVVPAAGRYVFIASLAINNTLGPVEAHGYHNTNLRARAYGVQAGTFGTLDVCGFFDMAAADFLEFKNGGYDRYGDAARYTRLYVFSLGQVLS